jgi:glycosyltransferase involved in cell wall biosynthesis
VRVLELSTFREVCGIATYTEALADAIRGAGASVDVLAPDLRAGVAPVGEQPPRLWRLIRATIADAKRVYDEARRRRSDVVHIQFNVELYSRRFLAALAAMCRRNAIAVVVTVHARAGGGRRRTLRLWSMLASLAGSDFIVHNEEHAGEIFGLRVHVIPHGVTPPRPRPIAESKRAIGLDPSWPVLAHFGFLHPDKGVEEVLRAAAEVKQRNMPELRYLVVGGTFPEPTSQAYAARLRQIAQDLGVSESVELTGEFAPDDVALSRLQAADWIILNYHTGSSQGTSGAARFALSAGRPLAVSRAPIFNDMRSAVHTLRGPLSAEISALLTDADLVRTMALAAERYCAETSWARVGLLHLELFERAIARARR